MTLNLGIVGIGAIAQYYFSAIDANENARLAAACDHDPQKLIPLATEVARYESFPEMLASDAITAVLVTLPNHLHFAACEAALDAGKHVCCEKPLTLTTAEAGALVEKAGALGLTLMTAFHRRHNCHYINAWRALRERPSPSHVTVRYLEDIEEHISGDRWYLDPAACGGGCLADNGPNAIDLVRGLLGVLEVDRAVIGREADGVDLAASVHLKSSEGATAEVELAWDYSHGECKDVRIDWSDGKHLHVDLLESFPALKSSLTHEYVALVDEFAAQQSTPTTHGEDGAEIVRLVDAAYAAARRSQPHPSRKPACR